MLNHKARQLGSGEGKDARGHESTGIKKERQKETLKSVHFALHIVLFSFLWQMIPGIRAVLKPTAL